MQISTNSKSTTTKIVNSRKIINGDEAGMLQLLPYKYPFADKFFDEMYSNSWHPAEVNLNEDAATWKDEHILNPEGLRNNKEFVNHKILDCIGDLFTSGYRIIASVNCSQGGHYLTNNLLRKLFEDKRNFSIIEIQERTLPHTLINRSLLRSIA